MKKRKNITLKGTPDGPYFSAGDETSFFLWLDRIKCVKKYEGHLSTLYIEVDPALVGENELCEMIALFLRYDVDMKQLAIFDSPKFSRCLKPWRKSIFGNKTTLEEKEEAIERSREFERELEKNRRQWKKEQGQKRRLQKLPGRNKATTKHTKYTKKKKH